MIAGGIASTGTREYALTPQRPSLLQAHCDACGHNWKIAQHERFVCPYCYNEPTQVDFKGSYVVLADEASLRWFA